MKDYLRRDYSAKNPDRDHDLQTLPALSKTAGYRVIDGDPIAEMRLDAGNSDSAHRLGIWRCSPGSFQCTEKGNELQTILSGSMSLVDESGTSHNYGPGDSFYTIKGQQVIWKIHETVTKVFFTFDSDGVDDAARPGPTVQDI